MKDIMLADTPVEQRAQILRDSCDQIVERSYTRKFDQEEINERRAVPAFESWRIHAKRGLYEARFGIKELHG